MTEILVNDNLSMNRINPYTATDTFGVSYNGGYKSTEALPWMMPREEPVEEDTNEAEDHFDPKAIFRSPAMNNMTGGVNPALSFMYPARKIQYDDGTTSWSREIVWKDGRNYVNFGQKPSDMFPIILVLVLLVIILGLRKYLKL